jgi:hypothetical protein
MPSSQIVDLAIGLIFVLGITAAMAAVITELIARFLGLRGAYLLLGLRQLLDSITTPVVLSQADSDSAKARDIVNTAPDPAVARVTGPVTGTAGSALADLVAQPTSATSALLGSPILSGLGMTGLIANRPLTLKPANPGSIKAPLPTGGLGLRRSLPSYISARAFADAVIDLVVPDAAGPVTMAEVQRSIDRLPDSMSSFRASLRALAKKAGDDVGLFGTDLEYWYNDHMDRVSGWYKRHVAGITLAVGTILILLLNINMLTLGRTLYTHGGVSAAVNAVAEKTAGCSDQTEQGCLADLQDQLTAVTTLPIGWGTVSACRVRGAHCGWLAQRGIVGPDGGSPGQLILVLLGFLITSIAIVPGARFWFDLLGGIGSLRATGPKPLPPAS